MRIIVAIPNYNAGATVVNLVEQLNNENFDRIYVMDDASTDDSAQRLYELRDSIELIQGEENLGPAGNRNRIIPYLQSGDIVVFIDADMELVSRGLRKVIESLLEAEPHVAIYGGGIQSKYGKPMFYNYGVHTSHFGDSLGVGLDRLGRILHFKLLVKPIMGIARKYTRNLDIRFEKPRPQRVDWVSEGHCYIRADIFKKVGGFDPALHYSEGKELAWRIRREGWGVMFVPRLWTRHLELKVRDKDENELRKEAQPVIEKKVNMMLKKYDMSDDDDPFSDQSNSQSS